MQIKMFSAPELHHALAMVRRDLGPDAVILDRHKCKDEDGADVWHLHAARDLEHASSPPPAPPYGDQSATQNKLTATMQQLERIVDGLGRQEVGGLRAMLRDEKSMAAFDALVRLGVSPAYASDIAGDIADGKPIPASMLHWGSAIRPKKEKEIVLLTGPGGGGKTTMAAKLATHFSMQGVSVAFISTDTERIGGLSLLNTYAEILGIPLVPLRHENEISRAIEETQAARLVLVDSEGWLTSRGEQQEKANVWRKLPCSRRFTVLPASMDEADGLKMLMLARKLGITELILSKLDETTRPGKLLNWAATGAHISYCSFGPDVSEQTGRLSPRSLASLLAGHINMMTSCEVIKADVTTSCEVIKGKELS